MYPDLRTLPKNGNGNEKDSVRKHQGGQNQSNVKRCLRQQPKPGVSQRAWPQRPRWAVLAPQYSGTCPGAVAPAAQAPRAAHTPFLTSSRPHSTSLCARPEAGRDRLRREARPHLPHPTDELGPRGLGGRREVGVWLQPQISVGLYSHHGGQEDFFQLHLHIPFPKHVWFLFCCICKRRRELGTCLTPLG